MYTFQRSQAGTQQALVRIGSRVRLGACTAMMSFTGKKVKIFFKRRNLVTRDLCLVSKVKFPMERLRLASTVDVS